MPRVHYVKKARKDNPVAKRGEPYYWWKFRFGGKRYSKEYPKRSQLTQSAYYASVFELQDMVDDYVIENEDDFDSCKDDILNAIDDISQECQDSLENMPENLQYSPNAELLQERIAACEGAQSDIESIYWVDNDEDDEDFEFDKSEIADALEQLTAI